MPQTDTDMGQWYKGVPAANGMWAMSRATIVDVITQDATGIDFYCSPPRGISGRVLDAKGKPLLNATVVAYDLDGRPIADGVTGVDGSYVLSGLSAQTYKVRAATEDGSATQWYLGVTGSATNFSRATGIDVTTGDRSDIDFRIKIEGANRHGNG